MLQTLSPLAEKRQTARRRVYLAAASIINIRGDVGADVRDMVRPVPEFVPRRAPGARRASACANWRRTSTPRPREWKERKLYLQTLVVMFYSSIVWRFLGLCRSGSASTSRTGRSGSASRCSTSMRCGGKAAPPIRRPPYLRAVSTGPLAPMVVAVTTAGGALEAGISYRTGAFEEGTVETDRRRGSRRLARWVKSAGVGTVE